jgi:DNA-binding LacI/PurR family transcriptional regulator
MTAAKLAKALNLSRTTVSLVLNGRAERYGLSRQTVEKVLSGAKRLNYQPDPVARQLAGMSSNVVGILVSSVCVVDPRLIERMEILAAERQLRFIVGHAIGDAAKVKEYLQDFRARRVDALVSFHHNHPSYEGAVVDELRQMERVLYYEKPAARMQDPWYVEVDYDEMGRAAASRFVKSGRCRAGLVGLSETIYPVLRRRRLGFQRALREAGLPHGRELVWRVDERQSLRWNEPPTQAEAEAVVEELVIRQRCDAIFAVNDLYAARLVAALRRAGRTVPGDVAVIGADNMDISTLIDPPITTIDVQIDDLARATVGLLFEMLGRGTAGDGADGPETARSTAAPHGITVKPKLVVRESA